MWPSYSCGGVPVWKEQGCAKIKKKIDNLLLRNNSGGGGEAGRGNAGERSELNTALLSREANLSTPHPLPSSWKLPCVAEADSQSCANWEAGQEEAERGEKGEIYARLMGNKEFKLSSFELGDTEKAEGATPAYLAKESHQMYASLPPAPPLKGLVDPAGVPGKQLTVCWYPKASCKLRKRDAPGDHGDGLGTVGATCFEADSMTDCFSSAPRPCLTVLLGDQPFHFSTTPLVSMSACLLLWLE